MRRLLIVLILGLGVTLGIAGGFIFHQHEKIIKLQQQKNTSLQYLQESREALHESQLRIAALRERPKPANKDKAIIAKRDATIQQLTSQLNSAKARVTQLQTSLSASKNESEKELKTSKQHFQQMQTNLQAQIDQLQKQLSSAQTDLKSSHKRIAALQNENDQLSNTNNAASARTDKRAHLLNDLQNIDRRRESYLTRIANRYRDITNQFRTMTGMLDSNRSHDSGTFNGPALDIIQNAITSTDNDLQHLRELNARAFRLQRQLSKQ